MKKIPNEITFAQFVAFTSTLNCFYCKGPITWTVRNCPKNGSGYNLDRKNNSLGYSVDNVVVCCKSCNRIRGNEFTHQEFVVMINALLAYRKGINSV